MHTERLFNVVLEGRPTSGVSTEIAIEGLAGLLRKQPDEVARYLNNHPRIVKRHLSRPKALQYCQKLQKAGLACRIMDAEPAKTDEREKSTNHESVSPTPTLNVTADVPVEKNNTNINNQIENKGGMEPLLQKKVW